jgi:hypothetical protein
MIACKSPESATLRLDLRDMSIGHVLMSRKCAPSGGFRAFLRGGSEEERGHGPLQGRSVLRPVTRLRGGDDYPPAFVSPGGGHGLVGMCERAALLGGEVEAGRTNGAFRVRARLPYGEAP